MENIEVEIRSFISKEKYKELLEFLKNNAEFIKEDYQETFYFDSKEDLRTQKNSTGSKIWLKKGKIHDECREELEIRFNKEDFEKANKIFEEIGLKTKIKWYRRRLQFNYEGTKICLDNTKGYGHIIELEKVTSEENKDKTLEELNQKLLRLGIEKTKREEFEKKFKDYENNWEEKIKNDTTFN